MSESSAFRTDDQPIFERQGFGQRLGIRGRVGLLIVDFVVGFADPMLFGGGNIPTAISNTAQLLALARRRVWPVAHTRIVFSEAALESDVFCLKVPTLRVLTESAAAGQFVPELQPVAGELVVRKAAPSAFFETNLRSWLTQKAVQTLLISGATTSGCVRASVVDAMSCGFRPIVMSDCVGDRAREPHDASLFDMQQKYADLLSLSELLEGLDRPAARAG
jgi:maleamate amidohydrolase